MPLLREGETVTIRVTAPPGEDTPAARWLHAAFLEGTEVEAFGELWRVQEFHSVDDRVTGRVISFRLIWSKKAGA